MMLTVIHDLRPWVMPFPSALFCFWLREQGRTQNRSISSHFFSPLGSPKEDSGPLGDLFSHGNPWLLILSPLFLDQIVALSSSSPWRIPLVQSLGPFSPLGSRHGYF
jgi:hypothetical protein